MGQAAKHHPDASDARHAELEATHPGYILKQMYLEPLGIGAHAFAEKLDLHERTVSRLLNAKSGLTTETALKLSRLLQTSPEFWLNLQMQFDLQQKRKTMDLEKYKPLEY